jgi:hypothetical protein
MDAEVVIERGGVAQVVDPAAGKTGVIDIVDVRLNKIHGGGIAGVGARRVYEDGIGAPRPGCSRDGVNEPGWGCSAGVGVHPRVVLFEANRWKEPARRVPILLPEPANVKLTPGNWFCIP